MPKQEKTEKVPDLLKKIKIYLDNGMYRFSNHATIRKKERFLSLPDAIEILRNGYHEKMKDSWENEFKTWNYSIRGKTVDHDTYRIIVSFEEDYLLIITVIRLD